MKNQQAGTAQAPVRAPIAISRGMIAAVFMIIIIVAVVAVVLIARGGGGGAGSIPVYSGANLLLSNPNVSGGGTTDYYDIGTIDGSAVYNWEKSQLQSAGWSVTEYQSYTAGAGGIITGTKGSDSCTVMILEGSYVAQICQQQGVTASKALVISYVPGTSSETPSQPC